MIKGLFTSASGMIPHVRRQELAANNLANAATPGFKKDGVFTQELSKAQQKIAARRTDWEQPMLDKVYTDHAPGVFDKTGNPLDMAIDGDGFFVLSTPDGQTVLTRSGSFTTSAEGLLEFPGGANVMGEGGPIEIGDGKVTISMSGEVDVDGIIVATIVPRTVNDLTQLEKIGGSMFAVPDGVELIDVRTSSVRQGYLETSNVDIVAEMVDMITSFRNYEANARAVQSQDTSLEHLFRRVAGQG